jgi:hypothetical protein
MNPVSHCERVLTRLIFCVSQFVSSKGSRSSASPPCNRWGKAVVKRFSCGKKLSKYLHVPSHPDCSITGPQIGKSYTANQQSNHWHYLFRGSAKREEGCRHYSCCTNLLRSFDLLPPVTPSAPGTARPRCSFDRRQLAIYSRTLDFRDVLMLASTKIVQKSVCQVAARNDTLIFSSFSFSREGLREHSHSLSPTESK